ncbi:hypothetical protein ACG04R_02655 [Roseateles sp. BYS78W]|uniref:Uncharacterized protein n=1 Tax=Pelomonas candidula TaxID=3299025 RepID=A0ABW7H786_9BURK
MRPSTDTRLIRCLDGLAMSFAVIDYLHADLHPLCSTLQSSPERLPVAFERCWSFVDAVHRIREIAQSIPGLSVKTTEVRIFLDATSLAEDFRHYIQHLRKELMKQPGNNFPVWGSLSWIAPDDPMLNHTVLAGAQIGETTYNGCVFDVVNRTWVSKVALSVGGRTFNFDLMHEACARFRTFVLPWIGTTYTAGIQVQTQSPVVSMRLNLTGGDDVPPCNDSGSQEPAARLER